MVDVVDIFNGLGMAVVAADADFKVVYQNEECGRLFRKEFGKADFVGKFLHECHMPETMEHIESIFRDFKAGNKKFDYYVTDQAAVKIAVINVPFHNDTGEFAGVVEFILEAALA